MRMNQTFKEAQLAALAKQFREAAGKSKADVARELDIAAPSIFNAEERQDLSLTKLRIRMIEAYSQFKVTGPLFQLLKK